MFEMVALAILACSPVKCEHRITQRHITLEQCLNNSEPKELAVPAEVEFRYVCFHTRVSIS